MTIREKKKNLEESSFSAVYKMSKTERKEPNKLQSTKKKNKQ